MVYKLSYGYTFNEVLQYLVHRVYKLGYGFTFNLVFVIYSKLSLKKKIHNYI